MSEKTSILPWDSPDFYPQAYALAAKRLNFVEHKGKRILTIDTTRADAEMVRAVAAVCWHIVSSQRPKSMRTLSDLSALPFSNEGLQVLTELVAKNRPYVMRGAVTGVSGLRFFMLQTIITVTQRPLKLFDDRLQALDWLAQDGDVK